MSLDVETMSDAGIRRANRRFLGHDFATDVVSFPLLLPSPSAPATTTTAAKQRVEQVRSTLCRHTAITSRFISVDSSAHLSTTATTTPVHSLLANLVVELPLLHVAQHLVRLLNFLELTHSSSHSMSVPLCRRQTSRLQLHLFLVTALVRVVCSCQISECLLNVCLRRILTRVVSTAHGKCQPKCHTFFTPRMV